MKNYELRIKGSQIETRCLERVEGGEILNGMKTIIQRRHVKPIYA